MFHKGLNYTGFDIAAGENVDVTGDAHRLSSHFPADKFDIVCSYSVFEHLLMPWVVAVEINKVLKSGGLVMTQTHQSWPVHDEPWDYFRFSEHSWHSIFNKYSGFEILQSGMGERCFVVPSLCARQFYDLEHQLGYMSSVCLAQKISDTPLKWDANPDEIIKTVYPA
ncbi:MAG: class I SAM-dependent methyltransferase, partial [Nitrospirae bacterium]|nr:class I SAM-dependent methyltransferase [Nitrospirota bacterium]